MTVLELRFLAGRYHATPGSPCERRRGRMAAIAVAHRSRTDCDVAFESASV